PFACKFIYINERTGKVPFHRRFPNPVPTTRKLVCMPDGLSISERIARSLPTLTPAHQRMARYVLDNLFRAATMRIDEFATAVDVSVATANRFARALGFEGYPQFRAELVRGFEATLAPVERLRTELERPSSVAAVMAAALEDGARNLEATAR